MAELIRIRPIESSGTWYDYKMAAVGTLMDYSLTPRIEKDWIKVYRNYWGDNSACIYTGLKRIGWKNFYIRDLPNIIYWELRQREAEKNA